MKRLSSYGLAGAVFASAYAGVFACSKTTYVDEPDEEPNVHPTREAMDAQLTLSTRPSEGEPFAAALGRAGDDGAGPIAVVQLRAEDAERIAYNLVGFQTRMKHPEQKRVFAMIPGLENAEFLRFGSVHRNTFVDSPRAPGRPWTTASVAPNCHRASTSNRVLRSRNSSGC